MKTEKIFIICRKELLGFSRDRRTLRAMMIFPIVFVPGLVYMFSIENRDPKVAPMVVSSLFQCIPVFFLSLISYIAFDITAGEKERGTMETTLSLFATRKELILGKYFAVAFANLIIGIIVSFLVAIAFLSAKLMSSNGITECFSSFDAKPLICYIVTVLCFAVFYPALLILIGIFARSTKEAFGYLSPIIMLTILTILAPLYGVSLTLLTVLIPGLNCFLITRQYLNYSVDWIYWIVAFCAALVYGFACLKTAMFLIERDTVLNRI